MKGNELVKWIEENHAEGHEVVLVDDGNNYFQVKHVWEGEAYGGSIMLTTKEPERMSADE